MDFLYCLTGILIPMLLLKLFKIRSGRRKRAAAAKATREKAIAERMRFINATPYLWGFERKEVGRFPFDLQECVQLWNEEYIRETK